MIDLEDSYLQAAETILAADALLIGRGAGMGVDSGLPDFRGPEGFWRAYPAFQGRRFQEISNPVWFSKTRRMAWGFFGHRLHLYRATAPHAGFQILRQGIRGTQYYFLPQLYCSRSEMRHFILTRNASEGTGCGPR